MTNELTRTELSKYAQCKRVLSTNRTAWIEYALALQTIKTEELFREEYPTWKAFCQAEEQITTRHADQLIASLDAAQHLIANENKSSRSCTENDEQEAPKVKESDARQLSRVPKGQREEVVEEAKKSGVVNAKTLKEAAEKVKKAKIPEPPEPPQVRKDKTGYPIPDHRLPIFDRAKEVKELLDQVSAVRNRLRRAQDDQDALYRPIDFSSTLTQLDAVFGEIKVAVPHAVCPFCQGQTSDQCRACHRRGVISQFHWNTTVPQELKDIRQAANS